MITRAVPMPNIASATGIGPRLPHNATYSSSPSGRIVGLIDLSPTVESSTYICHYTPPFGDTTFYSADNRIFHPGSLRGKQGTIPVVSELFIHVVRKGSARSRHGRILSRLRPRVRCLPLLSCMLYDDLPGVCEIVTSPVLRRTLPETWMSPHTRKEKYLAFTFLSFRPCANGAAGGVRRCRRAKSSRAATRLRPRGQYRRRAGSPGDR